MMIDPPIDKLIEKVGCKYKLVVVTGKRAKTLLDKRGEEMAISEVNPVTYAAKEIYDGSVEAREED